VQHPAIGSAAAVQKRLERLDLLRASKERFEMAQVRLFAPEQLELTAGALDAEPETQVLVALEERGEGSRRIDPTREIGAVASLGRGLRLRIEP
jgi:hypothetical protein